MSAATPSLLRATSILSKRPMPGLVKTRLTPALCANEAADLALAMLDDIVARHAGCAAYATQLVIAPAEQLSWFEGRYDVPLEVQRGDSLMERIENEFTRRGAASRSVVVIGSDAPLLTSDRVQEAHAALEAGAELVLIPDGGGGFSLAGLREARAGLFTGGAPEEAGSWEAVLARARSVGLACACLEPCDDVDTIEDLRRLASALKTGAAADCRHTRAALLQLDLSIQEGTP